MTYTLSGGVLNPTHSLTHSAQTDTDKHYDVNHIFSAFIQQQIMLLWKCLVTVEYCNDIVNI